MSPEQISETYYNQKSDIWSLGCICYEMIMLRPPFLAKNYIELRDKIKNGKYKNMCYKTYSNELIILIDSMLNTDIKKRPNISKILSLKKIIYNINIYNIEKKYILLKMKELQLKQKEKQLILFEKKLHNKYTKLIKLHQNLSKK